MRVAGTPGALELLVSSSRSLNRVALDIPVFAVIEPGQQPGVGAYSDDIAVIIDF